MKSYNFFISYSRDSNIELLETLINRLETLGFEIWYDKYDVVMGKNIYSGLENILEESKKWDGAILVLDKSYFEKNWCKYELEYFLNNSIPIYPILYLMNKEEIISDYNILKSLNLCRIKDEKGIDYAINKIIWKYLNNFNASNVKDFKIEDSNSLLKKLIYDFKNNINNNCYSKIFICDSIALCIQYSFYIKEIHLPKNVKILISIIHTYKSNYLLKGYINAFETKIVIKCTELLMNILEL